MKRIETATAEIFYEPALRLVTIVPFEGAEIDAEAYNDQFDAVQQLTKGVRAGVVIRAPFITVTREAREESLRPERQKYIVAQAIITSNAAMRIVGNFYIRVNRPKVPNRLFTIEAEARKWVLKKLAQAVAQKPV